MTHYSTNPGMVRVDYFKPTGKWYMTEELDMGTVYDEVDMSKAVGKLLDATRPNRPSGWWHSFTIVIMEPYSKFETPLLIPAKS